MIVGVRSPSEKNPPNSLISSELGRGGARDRLTPYRSVSYSDFILIHVLSCSTSLSV